MKNYYYFLGVEPDASADDIRRAYRKLSLKYHPDKNDNDPFFEKRFREIQEAYEILTDEEKRLHFDRAISEQTRTTTYTLPPSIKNFSINKVRVSKGEEIIISWQTNNADTVKILPFGLVAPYGEKKIKITEFKNGKFHIVLQAMNTVISKSAVKGITITEVSEYSRETQHSPINPASLPSRNTSKKIRAQHQFLRIFIALIFILIALFFILRG